MKLGNNICKQTQEKQQYLQVISFCQKDHAQLRTVVRRCSAIKWQEMTYRGDYLLVDCDRSRELVRTYMLSKLCIRSIRKFLHPPSVIQDQNWLWCYTTSKYVIQVTNDVNNGIRKLIISSSIILASSLQYILHHEFYSDKKGLFDVHCLIFKKRREQQSKRQSAMHATV